MVAYGEFRKPFNNDASDSRIVLYGMRYLIENYVGRRWTEMDVELADKFYATHNAAGTPFPFPKEIFLKFVRENDGYFPVTIESLPEGSVIYPHVPVFQITATEEYSRLCTFLETVLTMIWVRLAPLRLLYALTRMHAVPEHRCDAFPQGAHRDQRRVRQECRPQQPFPPGQPPARLWHARMYMRRAVGDWRSGSSGAPLIIAMFYIVTNPAAPLSSTLPGPTR